MTASRTEYIADVSRNPTLDDRTPSGAEWKMVQKENGDYAPLEAFKNVFSTEVG
jgi:hypothetical protein